MPPKSSTALVISRVILRTPDANRLSKFYASLLGLIPRHDMQGLKSVSLHHPTSNAALMTLIEDPTARHAAPQAPGLFHTAFLFAECAHWRNVVKRAIALAAGHYGASDHGVSWAIYLADPDGNGIELAWDKPADEWPWHGDQIHMFTQPLPLREILLEKESTSECIGDFGIGHLHLQVGTLEHAQTYQDRLGLRITQSDYPGALFMARGQYHHHFAINTWHTKPWVQRPENAIGLIGWDMNNPAHPTTEIWHHPDGYHIHQFPPQP